MVDILRQIEDFKLLCKDSKRFIETKKLTKLNHSKTISKDKLPSQLIYGTVYFIKNNSILQFSSTLIDENVDIRWSVKRKNYKCIVTFFNLNLSDISEFNDTSIFDTDELITYNSDRSENFAIALISTGFTMYLNQTN